MGFLPDDMDILPPSDDRVFKLILTSEDAKPALIDLVSTIIQRPVVDVMVRNNEIPTNDTEEKAGRLDVNCRTDDRTQVDIEMHAHAIKETKDKQFRNIKGKSIFYMCGLHATQSAKGEDRYDRLAQTFQFTLCTYNIFPERPGFLHSFSLRNDEDNELLSDAVHIIFVELRKLKEVLKKPVQDMSDMEKWAIFFQYADDAKCRAIVNDVIESKEALKVASERLMSISQDERERAIFRSRQMYLTDMASNYATVRDEGIEEGFKKGRSEGIEEGVQKVAKNLLRMGIPITQITEATGLSADQITTIQ